MKSSSTDGADLGKLICVESRVVLQVETGFGSELVFAVMAEGVGGLGKGPMPPHVAASIGVGLIAYG
jgi:hypothetical protein